MSTFDEVQKATRAYSGGMAAANRIVESIAGTPSLAKADPKHFPAIIRALQSDAAPDYDDTPTRYTADSLDPVAVFAHWNSFRRAPRDG